MLTIAGHYTDSPRRPGDLRSYLLLQTLPLVLVPLWQAIYRVPHRDRVWFGVAVLLYLLAKLAEVWDHELLATLGWISGHTLKHLLAAAAAGVLIMPDQMRGKGESDSGPRYAGRRMIWVAPVSWIQVAGRKMGDLAAIE
jgi:hypothetical protein